MNPVMEMIYDTPTHSHTQYDNIHASGADVGFLKGRGYQRRSTCKGGGGGP